MFKCCTLLTLYLLLSACGSDSNNAANNPPPQNEVTETFQQKLDNIVENSNIPGAIAQLNKADEIWIAASGYADKANQVEITFDTQMRIASMTKTLVAVTMLKLIEEGHFSLDDVIRPFLSEALNQGIPNAGQITIKQLLAMTSGIRNYTEENSFNDAIEKTPKKEWTATEVLHFILNKPANFTPETSWGYSNSNYVLCDVIVAQAMGTSLASQIRRILFSPLGMDSSYVEIQEASSASGKSLTAHGYEGNEDITDINDGIGLGDGGVVSTVTDLSLFLSKVFDDKAVLNDESLAAMQAFHATEDYGLGLEKRVYSIGIAYAHSGGSSGFSGDMLYFPETGTTWVFLTNQLEDNDGDFGAFQSLSSVLSE